MGAEPSLYNLVPLHTSPVNLWLKYKHFIVTDARGSVSALRENNSVLISPVQDAERVFLFFCFLQMRDIMNFLVFIKSQCYHSIFILSPEFKPCCSCWLFSLVLFWLIKFKD